MGPKYAAKENENAHAWSEKVRARYQGKQPLYDLGKILSDDFRVGHIYAPEYSKDPADVHPNSDEGQKMMAKGMLVLLTDTLKWKPGAAPETAAGGSTTRPAAETLAPSHPDYKAVQAILAANGLTKKKVEAISVVENGRVTKLYLQEGGVKIIPDAIAQLTELRLLHCYGDRDLKLPLLTKVSPAIGKCTKLEELLLNQNDLSTLPAEIAQLENLKQLSIADNKLKDLPPVVTAWAEKLDAKGLADQQK
jgi:leucine-rich repeat protein SHOC2